MNKKEKIIIFDTTLRDGEQSPGASLNVREKVEIAHALEQLGVDVIEAGFPVASPGDFEAVKKVAENIKKCIVAGLARCVEKDIETCYEAIKNAYRGRIHVFLATSAIHRKYKLRKAKSEILRLAVAGIKYARKFCDDVEFSPEDAARTEPDFLAKVVEEAIKAGAKTINIPDTVGYAIPEEFGGLIKYLFNTVPNIKDAVISVHCHNDLGLAVANSLAAIQNGARAVECTINGIGERAGNCAFEEIVMILKTRADKFPDVYVDIDTSKIYSTSRLVSRLTGMVVQKNKAIVGANAFAHEAGVHQDGVIKECRTYEIMRPEDIGRSSSEIVLGKHSGRHGLRHRLEGLGIYLTDEELEAVYNKFLELADKKKYVYEDDLILLARDQMAIPLSIYVLDYMHITTGSNHVPTATIRLIRGTKKIQEASCGDGPVDAALRCIDKITGLHGKLVDFSVSAVSTGKDAVGEVSLTVIFGNKQISSKGASTDIIEAAVKAYLSCVNRYLSERESSKNRKRN